MLFVYALAAAVSLTVAWLIKMIFAGVKMQKARAQARAEAQAAAGAGKPAKDGAG